MSRSPARSGRDAPGLLLAGFVQLLPAARRDWGNAMQAELAGIDLDADRWRFAAGCGRAIVRRPAPGALAALVLSLALVAATVVLTVSTPYLPMHVGLIAMMSVLGLVYLVFSRGAFPDPVVTGSRLAAGVRAGGALVVAGLALEVVLNFRSGDGDVVDRATTGVPILTLLLSVYLGGLLSLTAPDVVERRISALAAGLGVFAALIWAAWALSTPPLPLSNRPALAILAIAVLAAAVFGARRGAGLRTALCAILIGALSIFVLVHLLLAFGPAGWVPSDSAALTPGARLAQSRGEAGESYLVLLLVGAVAALALTVSALRRRRSLRPPLRAEAAGAAASVG